MKIDETNLIQLLLVVIRKLKFSGKKVLVGGFLGNFIKKYKREN